MFDRWAFNAASWVKQQNPEKTASVAVLQFALTGILNSLAVFVIVLTVGIVSGHFLDSLLASLFFVSLHFFSGGYHFKSALLCAVVSSSVIITSFLIPLSSKYFLGLTIFTIIIVAIFAPSNIENHARISKTYFPILKLISICIVLVNLMLQLPAVGWALFFQAFLLIPYSQLSIKRRWKLR
jgi:accessory gene regulator B